MTGLSAEKRRECYCRTELDFTLRYLTLYNHRAAGRVCLTDPVVRRAEVAPSVGPGHAGDVEAGVGRTGSVGTSRELGVRSGPDNAGPGVARHLALQHHLLALRHPDLGHRLHTGGD